MRRVKIDQLAQLQLEAKKEMAQLFTQSLFPIKPIQIPTPQKYPVDFDEFLRLTVGGRYKARRLKIYRDYAKDMILLGHIDSLVYANDPAQKIPREKAEKIAAPASYDEVEWWMQKVTKEIITNEEIFRLNAGAFLRWRAEQPRQRAKKAAARRWNKESPRNAQ